MAAPWGIPDAFGVSVTAVFKRLVNVIWRAILSFNEHRGLDLAAALAFYTLFSLAPLVVLVVQGLSLVLAPEQVEQAIVDRVDLVMGPAGATSVRQILEAFQQASAEGATLASALSLGIAVIGATSVLAQLQSSLRTVWELPSGDPIATVVLERVIALVLLTVTGTLLVTSLVATSVLRAARALARESLPDALISPLRWASDLTLSWVVFSFLFALLFRVLPNQALGWRDLLMGAATTGALFVVGKEAIAWYLGFGVTSLYGAAGSLAAVLIWVFYSAVILFFGAEVTKAMATPSA